MVAVGCRITMFVFCWFFPFHRLGGEGNTESNFDVEDFILRVVFFNLYNYGSFLSYCSLYRHCTDGCIKCPESNYSSFADLVSLFDY